MSGKKGMRAMSSTSPTHAQAFRDRVKVGVIADRLHKHVIGDIEMTATQVSAAQILLRKCVPDLSSTELSGNQDNPIRLEFGWTQSK
jgi:hypothetical protein